MSHELIRSWLGLPPGPWPPDHYTLLGLEPVEADIARIEQAVHERMDKVRPYQLPQPEAATEAMNRLAQALICLTDPRAKEAYDRALFPERMAMASAAPAPTAASQSADPLAWLFGPWNPAAGEPGTPTVQNWETAPPPLRLDWEAAPPPQRLDWQTAPPRVRLEADTVPAEQPPAGTGREEPPLVPPPDEANAPLDGKSPATREASARATGEPASTRRGLGTRRALYARVSHTRQLLVAWERAGKYLGQPRRLLSRPSEATELIAAMHAIRALVPHFPPLLGEAGQPGCLVLSLARREMIVPTLQTLLPSQRDTLARDWQAGLAVLRDYRRFLLHELRALRRRGLLGRAVRAAWVGLRHYPGRLLFLVAVIALNLAYPPLRAAWLHQVLALATVLAVWLVWWWVSLRPVRIRWRQAAGARKRGAKPRAKVRRRPHSSRA